MKTKEFFMHMRTSLCLMAGIAALCSLRVRTSESVTDKWKLSGILLSPCGGGKPCDRCESAGEVVE